MPEQRCDLVTKLLKAAPEKSNRETAKLAKVDDRTVAKIRRKLETTAEIPQLTKTVGADGKARRARASFTGKPSMAQWWQFPIRDGSLLRLPKADARDGLAGDASDRAGAAM